ncbi:MAG: acyltransferase, partial [Pseudomonadota bacterium]
MTYRRDIDGLRAIAVLAVVIYHAGWTTMSGGFLGVDVFFVISGYLITGILINDWEKGRYSLLTFYERRIRRIFPALFAMLAATILAAMFILLPPDLERLGASVLATTAFVSNIFFWSETGYFATSADSKPLLHTWSLAVEEQFYIFFPLILIGALAFGKRRALAAAAVKEGGRPGLPTAITVMLVLSVVSLIVAEWTVHQAADTAFYWPHTRAWELLAGALIAMDAFKPLRTRQTREWVSGIGFAMVIISLFAISSADTFPGLTAMPAVLGSALIIYAGHRQPEHLPVQDRTLVQQFLGLSPMVGIGLISYSLYLWHWPILVFAAQMSFEPLTLLDRTMLVIASIVAAYLSWRFVEQPFRAKSKPRIEPGARQLKPVQPAFWESRARIFASGGAMA